MPGFGNPFSFGLGGGDSEQETLYKAMRSAVGVGNFAEVDVPTDAIIEAWRLARARGLAAGTDDERAAAQTWPDLSTDFIAVWEDLLRTYFPADTEDATRRETLQRRQTLALDASYAGLTALLQDIDPSIVIRFPGDDGGAISRSLNTPPVSPATGDVYIVAAGGTGAWTGQDDDIATWNGASWDFDTPTEGRTIGVQDEDIAVFWDGSAWQTSKTPRARLATRESQPGRAFEDYDPTSQDAAGPAFNLNTFASGPKCTSFPNFSDDFILVVEYPLASGTLTEANRRVLQEIQALLNAALPSWVDFRIFTACGFVLDQDLLDVTAFCT